MIDYFTLGENDLQQIPVISFATNRFGYALHLLVLRFLGFYQPDLTTISSAVVDYVASQIRVQPEEAKKLW